MKFYDIYLILYSLRNKALRKLSFQSGGFLGRYYLGYRAGNSRIVYIFCVLELRTQACVLSSQLSPL